MSRHGEKVPDPFVPDPFVPSRTDRRVREMQVVCTGTADSRIQSWGGPLVVCCHRTEATQHRRRGIGSRIGDRLLLPVLSEHGVRPALGRPPRCPPDFGMCHPLPRPAYAPAARKATHSALSEPARAPAAHQLVLLSQTDGQNRTTLKGEAARKEQPVPCTLRNARTQPAQTSTDRHRGRSLVACHDRRMGQRIPQPLHRPGGNCSVFNI